MLELTMDAQQNYIEMYNSYLELKRQADQKMVKERQKKMSKWLNRYYNKVQDLLLENYDKRVNTFIRKMEQQPIKINVQQLQASNNHKLFRNIHKKERNISQKPFKFKDNEDWKSLLTPSERLERNKNKIIFQEKFGSFDIANRSIGSQSEYKQIAKNNFRTRDKNKEINPPMKYVNKSVRLNQSYEEKRGKKIIQKNNQQKNSQNSSNNNYPKRNLTLQSGAHSVDEDFRSQVASLRQHSNATEIDYQTLVYDHDNQRDDHKTHFRKMIDLQQTITDQKTKKGLKKLLIQCHVYRTKDKKLFGNEIQKDEFEEKMNMNN